MTNSRRFSSQAEPSQFPRKYRAFFFGLIALLLSACQGGGDPFPPPTLEEFIDELNGQFQVFGTQNATSIAVYNEEGWQTFHYGRIDPSKEGQPNDSTLYAIGELTELFTASLFAEQVLAGRIQVTDTVENDWDGPLPNWGDTQIRYQDLATHTTGLPTDPRAGWEDLSRAAQAGFYADFTEADLRQAVGEWVPTFSPGLLYRPSPLGMVMLARLLEQKTGKPYADLLQEQLLLPLGMRDTRTLRQLDQERADRLAPAWTVMGKSLPYYQWGEFDGSKSLLSTLSDMQKWVEPHLFAFSSIADITELTTGEQFDLGVGRFSGYGWQIVDAGGLQYTHRSGLTHMASHIRFSQAAGQAVIILTNTFNAESVAFMADRIWNFLPR